MRNSHGGYPGHLEAYLGNVQGYVGHTGLDLRCLRGRIGHAGGDLRLCHRSVPRAGVFGFILACKLTNNDNLKRTTQMKM